MYGTDLVLMMYCVTSPLSPLWWSQEEDHSFSLHLPVAPDPEGGGINLSPSESAHYWKHTVQIRLDRELSHKGGSSAGANSISLTHWPSLLPCQTNRMECKADTEHVVFWHTDQHISQNVWEIGFWSSYQDLFSDVTGVLYCILTILFCIWQRADTTLNRTCQ